MRFEDIPKPVSESDDSAKSDGLLTTPRQEIAKPERASTLEQLISDIDSAGVTVYEKLNATNLKAAREEFLSDSTLACPNNIYGNLDPDEVSRNLQTLDEAEASLSSDDISDKQRRYAAIIIDDYRRANDFLAANIAYNSAATPEEKAEATAYHHETNEAYYGKSDEDTFYTLLQEKLDKIHPDKLRPEDQAIYQSLLVAIGPRRSVQKDRFKPKPETIAQFSDLVQKFFEGPLSHIPEGQETFTPEEAANITNEILRDEFGGDTAYHASVAPERTSASVDHADRSITFPGSRPKGDYTRKDLESIIIHELGTHVYRAINYEGHPLGALSHGLPGNETWDEGVAKCVEQALAGKYQDAGVDHYINIGLATFKNKNFREVFDIGTMLKFLAGAKPDETDAERAVRLEKIRTANFNPVQRCFRGTGELVNNKDLAYYNGANQVWQYIEEHIDDPQLFDHLFLDGKSIATDPAQESIIYETHVDGL